MQHSSHKSPNFCEESRGGSCFEVGVEATCGKADCPPISGVFGAGKTLSAAAMIAGLLVWILLSRLSWSTSDGHETGGEKT